MVGGCASSGRQATSLPGLTANRLVKLKATVRVEARVLGDAHPSSVTVFATQWREAAIAAGAGTHLGSSRPVYLVVVRGHFHCYGCSPVFGSALATGDVMTLVLDRKTLLARSGGGVGGHVDTSGLGPGLPLTLG